MKELKMVTAEIITTCTVTCQPGSVVEVTEAQFYALGSAARELSDDVEITLLVDPDEVESVEKTVENVETLEAETVSETPENAESAPETPEKKSTRRKKA